MSKFSHIEKYRQANPPVAPFRELPLRTKDFWALRQHPSLEYSRVQNAYIYHDGPRPVLVADAENRLFLANRKEKSRADGGQLCDLFPVLFEVRDFFSEMPPFLIQAMAAESFAEMDAEIYARAAEYESAFSAEYKRRVRQRKNQLEKARQEDEERRALEAQEKQKRLEAMVEWYHANTHHPRVKMLLAQPKKGRRWRNTFWKSLVQVRKENNEEPVLVTAWYDLLAKMDDNGVIRLS